MRERRHAGAHRVDPRRVDVDLAVVGVCSVEAGRGLGAGDAEEAALKAAMLAAGSRRAVAVFNERLDAAAPFLIAPLEQIDQLVLEADVAPAVLARLRQAEHAPDIKLAAKVKA